ncbi:MAG: TatD family hydrolase [Gammaproteobacteria bacterium]|nr:TatD family hydrolase [Gammaproteobacteria bacterium]
MLIDSHCHLNMLDLADFDQDLAQVMKQASAADVSHMLTVCVKLSDLPQIMAIVERFPNVFSSVGVHPNETDEVDAAKLISLATHSTCIAIGETGLDYYRTEEAAAKEVQCENFRQHIQASLSLEKPLIIHTRQASEDTLRIMAEEKAGEIGGVMHCFSEDWDVAKRALDMNFYISFSGIVTFKSATMLQDVAKKVPADRILIETDSPYLAPVPFRGKQNHPALVKHVATVLSVLRDVDESVIAAQTTENFYHCFRVKKS